MNERVVLCEGFHDRAFWQGALEGLKCVDPGAAKGGRKPVLDLDGKVVGRGQFGFYTPSEHFVRVVPCHGKENVLPALRDKVRGLETGRIDFIVVNWDDDGDVRAPTPAAPFPQAVHQAVHAIDPAAHPIAGGRSVFQGKTRVLVAPWRVGDVHSTALPWKQTLERLVTSAIDAAYPGRGQAVGDWLGGLPNTDAHKPHAWSHMAGWFADHGSDGFYRAVWEDVKIRAELVTRLTACGAWAAMTEVAA
jgi:hypothetical protein